MSAISGFINTIKSAVLGEQVRTAIVNALEQCYSDVNNPSLQTEGFTEALNAAYAGGILDIQTVTQLSAMTNDKIIYRYNGTEAGKQKGLYYYSALASAWVLIGSEIQNVTNVNQMVDQNSLYRYKGTAAGMVNNAIYAYNGNAWIPIGSGLLEAATAAQMTNTGAIYKYTGSEAGYSTNALYYYNGSTWVLVSKATDTSLTLSGTPADAEAVGVALNHVSEEIAAITSLDDLFLPVSYYSKEYIKGTFILGSLTNGNHETNNSRIHSEDIISYDQDIYITSNPKISVAIHYYDANDTFTNETGWILGNRRILYKIPAGSRFRLLIDSTNEEDVFIMTFGTTEAESVLDRFKKTIVNLFKTAAYSSTAGADYFEELEHIFISGLPNGYERIEYIDLSATISNSKSIRFPISEVSDLTNYLIEVKFTTSIGATSSGAILGCKQANLNRDLTLYVSSDQIAVHYLGIDSGYKTIEGVNPATGIVTVRFKDGFVTANGVNINHSGGSDYSAGSSRGLAKGIALVLNGYAAATSLENMEYSVQSRRPVRIYSLTVKDPDGNTLVNLIPCKNENNVNGLFDTASRLFY